MTELKVQCDCGQNYKFDVEPVNNQMPFPVNCPTCGADGTARANAMLQAQAPAVAAPIAVATPVPMAAPPGGLRLSASAAPPVATPPPIPAQRYPAAAAMPAARLQAASQGNLLLGIVGAIVGAAIGAGIMYGFYAMAGVRFPLMGTGVGALTGLGARILYKGTDSALGAISGGIAAAAVVGAFYLMYGDFPPFRIITVVIAIYFAYRIAA